jgi:hypothetical protein
VVGIHDKLDEKIAEAIKHGNRRFADILGTTGGKYRAVDARLQALRRKGRIEFVGGQWRIVEQQP